MQFYFKVILISYFPNYSTFLVCSDTEDPNSALENSLSAKEKIISELNMELHRVETTLSNEREHHISETKKLNALLHEKVIVSWFQICIILSKCSGNLVYSCFFNKFSFS